MLINKNITNETANIHTPLMLKFVQLFTDCVFYRRDGRYLISCLSRGVL